VNQAGKADVIGYGGPLARVRNVCVGTLNLPKIGAVRSALGAYLPNVCVEGCSVASGVPEQPVGFPEIVAGARNRARAAYRASSCELAVGIEDGLVELPGVAGEILNVGAAIVTDGSRESLGLSSGFAYPPDCSRQAVSARLPIGELFDARFAEYRDGQAQRSTEGPSSLGIGNVGALTSGVLQRSEYGRHAVLCALIRFLHPDLYDGAVAIGGAAQGR
jgi:inosine/xanthosine triphosphatase